MLSTCLLYRFINRNNLKLKLILSLVYLILVALGVYLHQYILYLIFILLIIELFINRKDEVNMIENKFYNALSMVVALCCYSFSFFHKIIDIKVYVIFIIVNILILFRIYYYKNFELKEEIKFKIKLIINAFTIIWVIPFMFMVEYTDNSLFIRFDYPIYSLVLFMPAAFITHKYLNKDWIKEKEKNYEE